MAQRTSLVALAALVGGRHRQMPRRRRPSPIAFTDDDPAYIERMGELVDEFEAANPGVTVEFVTAGYAQLMEQLPLQLSVGQGPDLAKITDHLADEVHPRSPAAHGRPGRLRGAARADTLEPCAPKAPPADKIGGFMLSQTLNLPFVNKTLFEQAGVPLPEEGATLEEIVHASVKVAETTGVAIPFTMDRSGHRFSGPAFSYGAHYLVDGKFAFPDDAAKAYIADLYEWTQSGAFPKEMWGAAGRLALQGHGRRVRERKRRDLLRRQLAGEPVPHADRLRRSNGRRSTRPAALAAACRCRAGPSSPPSSTPRRRRRWPSSSSSSARRRCSASSAERFIIIPGANIENLDYQLDDPSAKAAMEVFIRNVPNVPGRGQGLGERARDPPRSMRPSFSA